jgi:hypothetical protein
MLVIAGVGWSKIHDLNMNRPNKAIREKRGPPEGELRKRHVLQM